MQMEEITNAMVAPRNDNRLTASKIFIKLIIDAFVQDDVQVATTLLLTVLTEMIESPNIEARVHAFNLVFNLSVHVNMFEEVPFFNASNRAFHNELTLWITAQLTLLHFPSSTRNNARHFPDSK